MSLLFGSTWLVNAVIISSFLVIAFASNAVAAYFDISKVVTYGLLLFVLVADFWFPYSLLNGVAPWMKRVVCGGWVALPVFFSGIIFSDSLKKQGRAAEVLEINLFGAVVGGILENSVMVGGTPILGILAITLYLMSALAMPLFRETDLAASQWSPAA